MEERAKERAQTIRLFEEVDEAELQYRDYYESEADENEDQNQEFEDYMELYNSGVFNFEQYEFIEEGMQLPIKSVLPTFDKKAFKFKYRMWNDPPHVYFARQKRMIERAMQRKESEPQVDMDKLKELLKTEGMVPALDYAQPYREYMMEEAVKQYADYYESDIEDL